MRLFRARGQHVAPTRSNYEVDQKGEIYVVGQSSVAVAALAAASVVLFHSRVGKRVRPTTARPNAVSLTKVGEAQFYL